MANETPEEIEALKKAAWDEYDADIAKLQTNYDNAIARAEAALEKGGKYAQSDYDRWIASAQRYSDLMAIEGRILQSSLNIADIKQNISNNKTAYQSTTYTGTVPKVTPKIETDYIPTNTPKVSPTPPKTTTPVNTAPPPPPVKTAPIDTILFDSEDTLPIEIMTDLIFEDIGGQELLNISRNDTINGQKIIYQPIKNLTQIQQEYNPNNILKLQGTSDKYFENFPIRFDEKVPTVGSGPNGAHVYIDSLTGDLIIETINTLSDEDVQAEIIVSGTIYEAVI